MNISEHTQASFSDRTSAGQLSQSQALANWRLKDVVHDVKTSAYCGPTAVAAITGEPISVVRDAYRFAQYGRRWIDFARRPPVMGTTQIETASVLRLFGFQGYWEFKPHKPTLAAYLASRKGAPRTNPTAIFLTGHVVAVRGWEFCDTFTDGMVVDADDAPRRRKRVMSVFVITGQTTPKSFPQKPV